MKLETLCKTTLKSEPKQSTLLGADCLHPLESDTFLDIEAYKPVGDHIKVTLKTTFKGRNTWYAFQRHVAIVGEDDEIIFPATVKLVVPYFDQLDNSQEPYGTCNVTSAAMCLSHQGATRRHPEYRFPDELNRYCDKHGLDRHFPETLVTIIAAYGCKDEFTSVGTFNQLKRHLIQGKPAIVHGWFTASGHIIAVTGFNKSGFFVNDPYGELMYDHGSDTGYYDTYASGHGLNYSYELMENTCCTDNQFWLHRVSR